MTRLIILVSGLPRSGTSLMMKMLEAGGMALAVDGIRQADDDNPKGYYELEAVKQLREGQTAWLSDVEGKTIKVVAPLLKFLPDKYEYKILFMRRAMPEILASQKQMLIRKGKDPDGVPDEIMARVFNKQLIEILAWIKGSPNISSMEIFYADLIANGDPIIEKIKIFLRVELDSKKMALVIDPDLYRQKESHLKK